MSTSESATAAAPLTKTGSVAGLDMPSPGIGRRRRTAFGTALGLVPPAFTGGLAVLDKLNPPTWLVALAVVSPLVGALFDLLSQVVTARIERNTTIDELMARATAEAVGQALRETPPEADHTLEVLVVRAHDGYKSTVRHRSVEAPGC